jgi:hypothetical protein
VPLQVELEDVREVEHRVLERLRSGFLSDYQLEERLRAVLSRNPLRLPPAARSPPYASPRRVRYGGGGLGFFGVSQGPCKEAQGWGSGSGWKRSPKRERVTALRSPTSLTTAASAGSSLHVS